MWRRNHASIQQHKGLWHEKKKGKKKNIKADWASCNVEPNEDRDIFAHRADGQTEAQLSGTKEEKKKNLHNRKKKGRAEHNNDYDFPNSTVITHLSGTKTKKRQSPLAVRPDCVRSVKRNRQFSNSGTTRDETVGPRPFEYRQQCIPSLAKCPATRLWLAAAGAPSASWERREMTARAQAAAPPSSWTTQSPAFASQSSSAASRRPSPNSRSPCVEPPLPTALPHCQARILSKANKNQRKNKNQSVFFFPFTQKDISSYMFTTPLLSPTACQRPSGELAMASVPMAPWSRKRWTQRRVRRSHLLTSPSGPPVQR